MLLAGSRKTRPKGLSTRPNAWDYAYELEVWRGGERIDPAVNYFVLMLDQLGLPTKYSCEGHPNGFYVVFEGPYEAAIEIHNAGFFSVQIEGPPYSWSIRKHIDYKGADSERIDAMRWAAQAWEQRFGPLDFDAVELVRG